MASTRRVEEHLHARFPQTPTKFYGGEHPFAEGLLGEVAETCDGVVIATVHYREPMSGNWFRVGCR